MNIIFRGGNLKKWGKTQKAWKFVHGKVALGGFCFGGSEKRTLASLFYNPPVFELLILVLYWLIDQL